MKNISLKILENRDLEGKIAILRLSTNVTVEGGKVKNDFRLRAMLPTLEFLLERGVRVIATGHMEPSPEASLEPVASYYRELFPVTFIDSCAPEMVRGYAERLQNGGVLFLENLRSLPYEKSNDEEFAKGFSSLADFYVNDAFPVSHREHASIVGIPRYLPSFAGRRFEREMKELSFVFSPERPFVFLLGGLKFKTKAPLIRKFIETADEVFVGGALANSFFKQKGLEIGLSASDDGVDLRELFEKKNLSLPIDVVVEMENGESKIVKAEEVSSTDSIVDVGPESIKVISKKIESAGLVVWNGPMGNSEKGFNDQTYALAQAVSKTGAYSIVGGGDTVASIESLDLEEEFSFMSTGGGAMLSFLVNETLPGIEALRGSPEVNF